MNKTDFESYIFDSNLDSLKFLLRDKNNTISIKA